MKYLAINHCPIHRNFYSISIDDENGSGTRLTPGKCCGQWKRIICWKLTSEIIKDIASKLK